MQHHLENIWFLPTGSLDFQVDAIAKKLPAIALHWCHNSPDTWQGVRPRTVITTHGDKWLSPKAKDLLAAEMLEV